MKRSAFFMAMAAWAASAQAQDTLVNVQDTLKTMPETYTLETSGHHQAAGYKTVTWSIGVEPSLPVGNFSNFSGFGLGGSLQAEFRTGRKLGITADAGYVDYFGKSAKGIEYADFHYWPLMGGLKLHTSENFYLHGQAGAGLGTNGLGTSFWYGAGIGLSPGRHLDAGLKYAGWHQNEISASGSSTGGGGGVYGGTGGGSGGGTGGGGGGGYGGHYSTIGLRLAIRF